MNIKYVRSYRSKNGNPVFVYEVTGNANDLAKFKELQGEFYREDELTGKALWFTSRSVGPRGKLIITPNGNIVPDMSAFESAASLAAQFGGNLGQELARAAANNLLGNNTPSADDLPAEASEEKSEDEAENDLKNM